eukprot:TRINITY_DN67796_c4_g9_i1.p1 TRINITY_DN67796_c4_g9~~TRINITY_DN67796_c4_g9_i1.p1  ORF type:complete len:338 (+),score=19.33 TRINITY_DN67796_c4_g9_i1:103-1014(+)
MKKIKPAPLVLSIKPARSIQPARYRQGNYTVHNFNRSFMPQWEKEWDSITVESLLQKRPLRPTDVPVVILSTPDSPRRHGKNLMHSLEAMGNPRFMFWDGVVPPATTKQQTAAQVIDWWLQQNYKANISGAPQWLGDDKRAKGAVGCLLAHLSLYSFIAWRKWPLTLILEDDTATNWTRTQFDLNLWWQHYNSSRIVRRKHSRKKWDPDFPDKVVNNTVYPAGMWALHKHCPRWGTMALLITYKMAKCLHDNIATLLAETMPIDALMEWHWYPQHCPRYIKCATRASPFFQPDGVVSEISGTM